MAYTSGISSYTSMQQSYCFTEKCFTLQKMHDGTGIMKSSSCSAWQKQRRKTTSCSPKGLKKNKQPTKILSSRTYSDIYSNTSMLRDLSLKDPKLFLKWNTGMLEAHITKGYTWMRSFNCLLTFKHWSRLLALFTQGLLLNLADPKKTKLVKDANFVVLK